MAQHRLLEQRILTQLNLFHRNGRQHTKFIQAIFVFFTERRRMLTGKFTAAE
ncbi:hypothetical protein D3C80_1899470 [compost metagenome]